MATDSIISTAGRTGVVLILNSSKSKKTLRHKWDKLPEYGALSHLSAKTIGTLVDYCIAQHWLRIEYVRDGIPFLFHTQKGWLHVKQLWVTRIIGWFEEWKTAVSPPIWPAMEEINREIKVMLLQEIEAKQQRELIPVLRAWYSYEVRKVRLQINHTLQAMEERPLPPPAKIENKTGRQYG